MAKAKTKKAPKTKPAKKPPANAGQTEIAGTERPDAVPEIDEAAASYFSLNNKLKTLKDKVAAARQALAGRMVDHKLAKYTWIDGEIRKICTFDTVGQVKLRNAKKDEADE